MEKKEKKLIDTCPVRKSLDIIGGKWKLLIIGQFFGAEMLRYGDLKKLIPEISEKMLNQELKFLLKVNILSKKVYHEIPLRVEYSLTDLGRQVIPFIGMLADLGNKLEEIEEDKVKV